MGPIDTAASNVQAQLPGRQSQPNEGSAWKIIQDPVSGEPVHFSPVSGQIQKQPGQDPILEVLQDLQGARVHVKELRRLRGPNDEVRDSVRNGTKKKLAEEIGLLAFGQTANEAVVLPPLCDKTCLFHDSGDGMHGEGTAQAHGEFLLGRFDVVALPAVADFDAVWKFIKGGANKRPFWVLHAAALNVGENDHAADFKDYSIENTRLKTTSYIEDMGRVYENVFNAVGRVGAQDVIWFPFGMGAFLRNLHKLDASFSQERDNGKKLIELRQALANRFVDALQKAYKPGKFVLRLCVSPSGKADEQDANAYAFLAAVRHAVQMGQLSPAAVKIDLHADALFLAQQIADEGRVAALLNGANRCLIGNHWFESGARLAIDENIHRRSWRMSAIAYMLNGGAESKQRSPSDLADAVRKLGGKVQHLKLKASSSVEDGKSNILAKFRAWDTSRDGRISKSELAQVLVSIGIPQTDVDQIFIVADTNQDGFISYQEFVTWLYGNQRPEEVFKSVTSR